MASEFPSIEFAIGTVFKSLKELKLAVRKFTLNILIETDTMCVKRILLGFRQFKWSFRMMR
jgi:hypothetical protein